MSARLPASTVLASAIFCGLLLGLFVHSLAPTWNDGASYYSHGWIVGGAAVALMLMRWRQAIRVSTVSEVNAHAGNWGRALAGLVLCVAVIFLARMVWTVDVTWRPPLWAQSLATVAALAILVWKT